MYGNKVSHAKNRTKRIFKPNLHSARVVVGGVSKRVKLCTKCRRMLTTAQKPEVQAQTEVKPDLPANASKALQAGVAPVATA